MNKLIQFPPVDSEAQARNPDIPAERWLELARLHPAEALENPLMMVLFLEDPNLADRMADETVHALIQQPGVPLVLQMRAARKGNLRTRQALARLQHTPPEVLELLLGDPDPKVRAALLAHPGLPAHLFERLSMDPDPQVQAAVARCRQAPEDLLWELARTAAPEVRAAVPANPRVPVDLLEVLAQDTDPGVAEAVARSRRTHPDVLRALMRHPRAGRAVLLALVENPGTPRDVLYSLSGYFDDEVRNAVLGHPQCPVEVLERLEWRWGGIQWAGIKRMKNPDRTEVRR